MRSQIKISARLVPLFAVILGMLLPSVLLSQSEGEYGTTMNLSYGTGARAMGLGRAYTAAVNDPTAVFWNPAGLERAPRMAFTLFHNQLFEGSIYDFVGFVYPTLTYGTVGLGLARLGTGDIPVTTINNEALGDMQYDEAELYLSYAKKLPFRLLGGISFKIRRQNFTVINQTATGLGIDLGLMYQPQWENQVLRNLSFGLNYRNLLSPELKLGSVIESEPYHLTFGILKGLPFGEGGKFNIVLDYHQSKYESGSVRAGTEYIFRNMGIVRVGMDNGQLAFGAGVQYSLIDLDYSFGSSTGDGQFPPTHRFSITFNIGKTRQELVQIAEQERIERERALVERTKEEERQNFISERMDQGKEYLSENRYFDAYVEFQQVISVDPFNQTANALMDSANNMIQSELQERQDEAISQAVDKQMAEADKNFVNLHFEKGKLFLEKNQFTDALIEFNLALERDPNNPTIKDAIASAKRRLEQQVRVLVSQGREEFQQGNYSNALQILSEALVLAPEDPGLKEEINTLSNRIKIQQYIQQALQYFDLGQYQQALELFEEAHKMDPSNQRLSQYIERTKRGMGVESKEMDQEAERRYIHGVDLFLAGRYKEALAIWKELEKEYPYSKKLLDAIKSAEERLKRTGN